jgi:dipeptidyl-peptidase-3
LTEKEQTLGLGAKGLTTYFSYNCTNEDSEKINKFFKEHNIEGYINRAIKTVRKLGI